jgi:hypothetical protein
MRTKPTTATELIPKFNRIGDDGWGIVVHNTLNDYGIPIPSPVSKRELDYLEKRLEIRLNNEHRIFLETFGCVVFDGHWLIEPENMKLNMGFNHDAPLLQIASCMGCKEDTDVYAMDLNTGKCCFCDAIDGLVEWTDNFSILVKIFMINLSYGNYGWFGDTGLYKLADDAYKILVNTTD